MALPGEGLSVSVFVAWQAGPGVDQRMPTSGEHREVVMQWLLRRLFGSSAAAPSSGAAAQFFLDIACDRCGERFHLHINRATDCLQIFDEPGIAWRLQREVVGAGCRSIIRVRVDLGPGGRLMHREIANGHFIDGDTESMA
jgi:hypothetical protein